MSNNRREFLKAGLIGGAVAATGLPTLALAGHHEKKPAKSLEILVLGGTGFIGPHMVREALRRGHNVTLFNRGRTNNALFPDLETIKGDRADNLKGLEGRSWDVVIDNSGYVPRHVENSARLLSDNVSHYLFISSVSVYADFNRVNAEDAPLATIEDETVEEVTGETYGALKALCEKRTLTEVGEDRVTVVRPTYICGPGDHTDRFTYYPVRTQKGGEMLWPGSPSHEIQIVDVRDLANFVVDCVQKRTQGIFNAVTPIGAYTFADLLEDSQAVTATTVDPVWVDDAFIAANEARDAFPIYFPREGEDAGRLAFSGEAAFAAGLHNRPPRETVRDLMTWWATLSDERIESARFRMTPEREATLLEAWKARGG
ncbi:MAG: NAD-dependent epimerase/dehydratase family protein [Woeseiaceae bacterium]|nr:NAD-dependent epimerase/dehydratase family protein [Woeseiaceae bacterium]